MPKLGLKLGLDYRFKIGGTGVSPETGAWVLLQDVKLYGMIESGTLTLTNEQAVGMANTVEW